MRVWPAEEDLPDGVLPGGYVANVVAAELQRADKHRRIAAEGRRPSIAPPDAEERNRLLAGARRGDREAIDELWRRYRVRLVPVSPAAEAIAGVA